MINGTRSGKNNNTIIRKYRNTRKENPRAHSRIKLIGAALSHNNRPGVNAGTYQKKIIGAVNHAELWAERKALLITVNAGISVRAVKAGGIR